MNSNSFSSFLAEIVQDFSNTPLHVIDASIPKSNYTAIDLSHNNPDLQTFDVSSSKAWETYITNYLKKHNKKVAFGGYLEKRSIYNRSTYFSSQTEVEQRNIHLGLDLWVEAETPVLACFDGVIHSFKDNTNFGDYGPTVILEHIIKGKTFYSLYGHLSRESLMGLKVGEIVSKGQTIARLGDALVNGDYASHLHLQIIKDLQGNVGDYPGVCSKQNLEFYERNTVNPELVLGL